MNKKITIVCLFMAMTGFVHAQGYTTLGIGISSPEGTLHVHSSTPYFPPITPPVTPDGDGGEEEGNRDLQEFRTILHVTNANTGTGEEDGFSVDLYNSVLTLQQYEDADFTLQNHNAKIILSSGGKVGVGAVSNSHAFNVSGTARVTGQLTTGSLNVNNSLTTTSLSASSLTSGDAVINRTLRVGNGFYCDDAGALKVKSLRVTLSGWPDYVFEGGYRLMPLAEVEEYIDENGHLPAVPSAGEVDADGVDVGEMNKILLQKVEELTLYIIDLQKQLDELKSNK